MKNFSLAALLLAASAFGQVSVSIVYPHAGASIGQIYQGSWSATATGAHYITKVELDYDSTGFSDIGYANGSHTTGTVAGVMAVYAKLITAGSHTITLRATDDASTTNTSTPVSFTALHSNPVCSHTQLGTSTFYCEEAHSQSNTTLGSHSVSVTFPSGFNAGDLIHVAAFAQVPFGVHTLFNGAVDAVQTTIPVTNAAIYATIGLSPPFTINADTDVSTGQVGEIMTITALNTGAETITVTRGVGGTTATTHPDRTIALSGGRHPWQSSYISDSLTSSWRFWNNLGTLSLDDDSVQMTVFTAFAATTTASPVTITLTNPDANSAAGGCCLEIINATRYSGVGAVDGPGGRQVGWGGPTDGSANPLPTGGNGGNDIVGTVPTTSGDLVIGALMGAPVVPTASCVERLEDGTRPYAMTCDAVATGSTATPQFLANIDGYFGIGLAFQPPAVAQGQSSLLSTNTLSNGSVPLQSGSCREDFEFHDGTFTSGAGGLLGSTDPCGMHFSYEFVSGVYNLQVYNNGAVSGPCAGNPYLYGLSTLPSTGGHQNGYFRYQVNFSSKTDSLEEWDGDGTYHQIASCSWTVLNPPGSGGFSIGGANSGDTFNLGFFHVYPSNVPLNSKMPTFGASTSGALAYYSFDTATGNLVDQSGNGRTLTNTGSVTFPDTPGAIQAVVLAVPTVCGAPSYSPWVSMKVNAVGCTATQHNGLDGTKSLSQATGSDAVTCTFTNVSGPVVPTLTSTGSCTSDVGASGTLSAFGLYTFNLHVVDAASNTADKQLSAGAVPYDNNGVVIPDDPKVTQIFGPMIAFGQSGWGYMDERNCAAARLQIDGKDCAGNQYQAGGNPYPAQAAEWLTAAAGTISYPFAGIGPAPGQGCPGSGVSGGTQATLNGGITATAASVAVLHAECLSLTTLPTWIMIGNTVGATELVRITATTATTGPATLTVGFDGRGMAGAVYNNSQPIVPAQSWPSGTIVGEMRIVGSSTQFISDSARPLCPAGAPGPPGPVTYSTGTVSGVGGSTTLTGSGTSWTQNAGSMSTNVVFLTDSSNNTITQQYIRVAGTHGGGTPFVFWALVTAVASGNGSVTISRPLPADFDAGSFNYKITAAAYWSLEFVAPNTSTQRAIQQALGCESETAAFAVPAHDISAVDLVQQSGVKISYKTEVGAQGPFGPNFYGTGLMERSFYERSGYTPALTAANSIDDRWVSDPELCGGYCGGLPLLQGGGVIGGIVDKVLNPSTPLGWLDVTGFAQAGAADAARNCNYDDPRDQGYQQAWLALVADFDTDLTRQIAWNAGMLAWVARDAVCRRNASDGYTGVQVNSWAGSSVFSTAGPALTLQGSPPSTAVTGTGFTAGMCAGLDDGTGTLTVTPGGTAFTVITGTVNPGLRITITDTSGTPIPYTFEFSIAGSSGQLAWTWPGSGTGPYHFMVEGNNLTGFMTSIGLSNADWPDVTAAQGTVNNQMLQKFWACKYNSPTSLTLNRPWDDANGSAYHMYSYVVSGFQDQPFMASGPKSAALNWASQNSNPVVAAANTIYKTQLSQWVALYGLDTTSPNLGMYYNRVSGDCEPGGVPNAVTLFDTNHGPGAQNSCGSMGLLGTLGGGVGEFASRVNTGEGGIGVNNIFATNPTPSTKAIVDTAYGAIYGDCSMTSLYCDSHFVNKAGEMSNASLGAYKWSGFFFGMGMAHQWPAVRIGGRSPRGRNRSGDGNQSGAAN